MGSGYQTINTRTCSSARRVVGSETSPRAATSRRTQTQQAAAGMRTEPVKALLRALATSERRKLLIPPRGPQLLLGGQRTDSPRAIRNRRPRSGTAARQPAAYGRDRHVRPAQDGNGRLNERAHRHARCWPSRGPAQPHDHGHTSRSARAGPLVPSAAPGARPTSWLRCDGSGAWES